MTITALEQRIEKLKKIQAKMLSGELVGGGYYEGGHITKNTSPILKGHNFHMKEQALDVLNTLQSIEWCINEDVFAEEEIPKEPFENKDQERSFELVKEGTQFVGEWLIEKGNSFYFVHKFDFRGRIYTQGHDINLQSSEYRKSLLDFKHKEVINA